MEQSFTITPSVYNASPTQHETWRSRTFQVTKLPLISSTVLSITHTNTQIQQLPINHNYVLTLEGKLGDGLNILFAFSICIYTLAFVVSYNKISWLIE